MSDLALSQGLYMRSLNLRETVVVVMDTLNEFYRYQGWDEARIALAELELIHFPKYVNAMMHLSSASHRLRQRGSPGPFVIPGSTVSGSLSLSQLEHNAVFWRRHAEDLGWQLPDQTMNILNTR